MASFIQMSEKFVQYLKSLQPNTKVCLDTAPIIYSVEKVPPYWEMMHPIWQLAHDGKIQLFGSELLLIETLVKPLKNKNTQLVQTFRQLLTASDIQLEPISASILEQAAQLRAISSIKTPDAIHLATAIHLQADLFITNDKQLTNVQTIPILMLKNYI